MKKAKKRIKKAEKKIINKVKEVVIDKHNPPFDPEIPEQKQRWLR